MALTGSLTLGPDRHGRVVAIVDGRIVATAQADAPVIACADGEIAPGAVCAHTHLYSALVPYGMPPTDPTPTSFLDILGRIWWRLDRAIDAQALRAGARDYIAKALLAGTTALIDHHESPNAIAGSLTILKEACEELGVRAVLCYGATERNNGRAEACAGLDACARLTPSELVRGAVGLHASFTVSDATIRDAGALARARGMVLHVHLAEDASDVADARTRGYAGPLERLIALDALPPGSILAHGVHLTADQVRLAASRGAWFVHNPRSNEGNGVGYATHLSAAKRVALGTDGWVADMVAENHALHRLATLHHDRGVDGRLDAGQGLIAEHFGFAKAGLAFGAPGDVVVREHGGVRHVVVAGRVVVFDGRLTHGDAAAIEDDARREASRLWQRLAKIT